MMDNKNTSTATTSNANDNNNNNNRRRNSYSAKSHMSTSTTSTSRTAAINNFVTSMNIMDTSNGSRKSNSSNNDNAYHFHHRSPSGSPISIDSRDNNNTQQYDHPTHHNNNNNNNNNNINKKKTTKAAAASNKSFLSEDDDLFFTLTARQMAKLFRTKKALCNEPMTLRVNKTVFCCHAVLLDNNNNIVNNNNNNDSEDKNNNTPTGSGSNDSIGDNNDNSKDVKPPPLPPPLPPRDASSISSSVVEVDNDNENNNNKDDQLQLFSIVVALSGSSQHSALPFSSFWDAGGGGVGSGASGEDRSDLERYLRQLTNEKGKGKGKGNDETITTTKKEKNKDDDNHHNRSSNSRKKKKEQTAGRVSSAFLAIRRVHISLVRFCRALHREENRCGYVTYQSRALFRLRNERQKQWEKMWSKHHRPGSSSAATMTTNVVGGGGGDRNASHHHHHHHTPQHSRQNSFIVTPGSGDSSMLDDTLLKNVFGNNNVSGDTLSAVEREQEKEQEILELMLACNPQDHSNHNQQQYQPEEQDLPQSFQQQQYGNMVRDLVAVFHSLSRNDHEYPPTPSSLLCERDAVVYVNQHVAIPIEAAGLNGYSAAGVISPSSSRQHVDGGSSVVRPYYTLLFPHASPSELLQTFHASGSAPPQQMEHLLLTVNPQKSMTQIAIDANLPMHTTMQISSSLVAHGACIPSPIVTSRSRLMCPGNDSMQRIPELALEFSQAFPGINLFGVVSFLTTSSRHLGDAIAVLLDTENEEGSWLRESLLASPKYRYYNNNRGRSGSGGGNGNGGIAGDSPADGAAGADINNGTHALFLDEETYSPIHASYASSRGGGAQPPTSSGTQDQDASPSISVHRWLKDLEELLYAIAIWLLSHGVLTQLQEYMVMVVEIEASPPSPSTLKADSSSSLIVPPSLSSISAPPTSLPTTATTSSSSSITPAPGISINRNTNNDFDENLFKELIEMDYLNGDISIMALSWRMAIDPQKLRRWGLRHKRIRVVSRVPTYGDDWEQPILST
ncbi:hypothetical protein FRACYDRAFT_241388 [Fragilariopsis cylindrus CCMP1102]|uniref:Uncharacterized protein n=1 Tax=Fragilariopsis cylindrus CCMP1102 TaxID=635003 RepID=A0A1E7F9H7_9STRA|nr:hypothetical protein FRACYDRAFT_241388 [Fragilariopsis cylindrus CCMP1102]|eukprot:OEU14830.1 hypothetical protein FRACYDRAFT_241388 [Fragilariopsis cylindrus CCMP1102]